MHKIFLVFIVTLFTFNLAYAEPFKISSVQKTAGIPLSEMAYELPYKDVIVDYDYSRLSDKEKVKKANEFLLKLNVKPEFLHEVNSKNMNKGYVYFLAFHKYIMESLASIKDENVKKSQEYHLAYTLGYLAKNGLYEYESILSHIKHLKGMSLAQMQQYIVHKEDNAELIEKIYNLITVLNKSNFSNDSLAVAHLYDTLIDNNITNTVLFEYGYLDTLNSNQDFFSIISTEGADRYSSIDVDLSSLDYTIFNTFIYRFSDKYNALSSDIKQKYTQSLLEGVISDNTLSMGVSYYFYPFNKNVYVIRPEGMPKSYNMYLLTIDNIEMRDKDNGLDRNLFIENKAAENTIGGYTYEELIKAAIDTNDLFINDEELAKIAPKSPFIKNGNFDDAAFMEYLKGYIDKPHAYHSYIIYYKFDINNDGKDEMIVYSGFELPRTYETVGNVFLADEKTLKIKEDNKLGQLLKVLSGNITPLDKSKINALINKYAKNKISEADILDAISDGFNFYLYEQNGKKKIALVSGNRFVDIFYMNDNLEVTMGYLKAEKSNAKLVWKGKTKNGKPTGLLTLDASFDMSKASTLSEKAIVDDANLKMLDRMSSALYFDLIEGYNDYHKKEALKERRQMNKDIKNCNGKKKCIFDILFDDVFNKGA